MPIQGANLNTDQNGKLTSGYYGDRGDGTDDWHNVGRIYDGGHETIGARADAGSTATDTTAVTLISAIKGLGIRLASLITQLSVGASALLKAEDAAHASGDAGVQVLAVRKDTAAVSSGTTGDYEPVQTDAVGRLRVRTREDEVDLSNARTTALAASLVVKASAGKLFGFQGYATSAGFVQIHNTASVPAEAAVPVEVIPVEANKPFSLGLGNRGIAFSTGITILHSSTGPTKTISGSVMWVSAQYE